MIVLLLWACTTGASPAPPEAIRRFADQILSEADTDGDGMLSQEEYATVAMPDEPMLAYDHNSDRMLSAWELVEMLLDTDPAKQQEARRRGGRGRGKAKGKRGHKAGRPR